MYFPFFSGLFQPVQALKPELGSTTVSEALDFFGNCSEDLNKKENKNRSKVKRRHSDINITKDKEDDESSLPDIEKKKQKKKKSRRSK